MKTKLCKNCVYYLQHYIFFSGKLSTVYCGHCLHQKVKRKRIRPDTDACDQFDENTTSLSDIFASKEYLTKALVQKILDMELLPEIPEE